MTDTATSTAWYVYAVVGPVTPELRRAVEADGLRLAGEGDLAAVAASVSLAEFGEDVLPQRLNDRGWLEKKARAHEDVLFGLTERTTVVPFRFGSIYRDLEAVDDLLDRRREAFAHALETIRGRVELGVKAWRAKRAPTEPASPATGREYLQRRLSERQRAADAAVGVEDALRDAHTRFLAHAVDAVLNRPQPRELTGRAEDMVMNAAYLVAAGDTTLQHEVAAVDAQYRGLGLTFELTGPWPAHNFVDLGEEE